MPVSIIVVIAYFLVLSLLAYSDRAGRMSAQADFSLAGRNLSGLTLLATLAASNLSAFTVFGVSGAGYRLGWAFFPVMAFGTGFMAISFAVVGVPLRRMSALKGWTSPGDLVRDQLGSKIFGKVFSGLSLLYTLPYLAVQAGAGGQLLAGLTGLPREVCSALLMAIIAVYVSRGGLKTVARSDIIQLSAMVIIVIAAGIMVAYHASISGVAAKVSADAGRMSRSGVGQTIGWLQLLGYYVLWALADPMFPHLTQRFYAAKSDKALIFSMSLYPVVAVLVFFPVSMIGVFGSAMVPGLTGAASDTIYTVLTTKLAGPIFGPIFSVAALAALVSTMDSQLLSCASIIGSDFFPQRDGSTRASVAATLVLAAGAWLVSLNPPESIVGFLGRTAFPGYATLMPVALVAIYKPGIGKLPPLASLVAATVLVVLEAAGFFVPPIPAALFNAAVQAVIILVLAVTTSQARHTTSSGRIPARFPPGKVLIVKMITLVGILGVDFWNYGRVPHQRAGLPDWLVYHILLTLFLSFLFHLYQKQDAA